MSGWIFLATLIAALLTLIVLIILIIRAQGGFKQLGELWEDGRQMLPDFTLLGVLTLGLATSRGLYKTPWLLVAGEPKSGQKALLESLSAAENPSPHAWRLLRQHRVSAWKALSDGVLIEAPEDAKEMSGVLRSLNMLRPERPLDGLVLTISADILLSKNTKRQLTVAKSLRGLIWEVQKSTEFRLPVYVLVTQSDRIEGYSEFWNQRPELQDQIFGWSSPYPPDAEFQASWPDEGLRETSREIQAQLGAILHQLQETPIPAVDVNKMLRFPARLQSIHTPLSTMCAEIFRGDGFSSPVSFRGLYFSGQPDATDPMIGVGELAQEKWFKEKNLAVPLRQAVFSRAWRLRRLQQLSVVGLATLVSFGVTELLSMSGDAQRLSAALDKFTVATTQKDLTTACQDLGEDRLSAGLSIIEELQTPGNSILVPASLVLNPFSDQVSKAVASTFLEPVLLPGFKCALEAEMAAISANDKSLATSLDRVMSRVDGLLGFEEQTRAFRDLTKGPLLNGPAIKTLSADLLKTSLTDKGTAILQDALRFVPATSLQVPSRLKEQALGVLVADVKNLRDSWTTDVRNGKKLLSTLSTAPSFEAAQAVVAWSKGIEADWLSGANLCRSAREKIQPELAKLVAQFAYTNAEINNVLEPLSATECDQKIDQALANLTLDALGQIAKAAPGPATGLVWVDGFKTQMALVEPVLADPLLKLKPRPARMCGPTDRIAIGGVQEALALVRQYQTLVAAQPGLRQSKGAVVQPLVAEHVEMLVEAALTSTLETVSWKGTLDNALERESELFEPVAEPLNLLASLYQQTGLDLKGAKWFACANQTTLTALVRLEELYHQGDLYLTEEAISSSEFVFKVHKPSDIAGYLGKQRQRAEQMVGYARPWVSWFQQGGSTSTVAQDPVSSFWVSTVEALDALLLYKDTSSGLAVLETYFKQEMTKTRAQACEEAALDRPVTSSFNIFSDGISHVHDQIQSSCVAQQKQEKKEVQTEAQDRFASVAKGFNQLLKGQYPFAGPKAPDLPPGVLATFVAQYGKDLDFLAKNSADLKPKSGTEIHDFITNLHSGIEALSAAYKVEVPQALNLEVTFRARQPLAPGTEEILRWTFNTSPVSLTFPLGGKETQWLAGAPVSLTLQWADLAVNAPDPTKAGDTILISGKSATVLTSGHWALIRFIQAYRVGSHATGAPYTLQFEIPVVDANAKTGKVEARIALVITEADTKVPWTLPFTFPDKAPTAQWDKSS